MSGHQIPIKIQLVIPSASEINKQLKPLQDILKNKKLDIKLNVSPEAIKGLETLSKLSDNVAKKIATIKSPKFDLANPSKEAQSYLNRIDSLVTGLKRFNGEVKYTYDALGKVNIQVQNAEGILKKYTLQWDSARNVLRQVNRQDTNLSNINAEKQLLMEQKIRDAIIKKTEAQKQALQVYKSNYFNVKIPGLEGLYKGHTDVDGINSLTNRIKSLNATTPNLQRELKNINIEYQRLQTNAKISAKEMGMLNSHAISFGESMRTALIKFPVWLLAGSLILQPLQQLQQGIRYVYELDKALTDLQKVTNETKETYSAFAKEASDIGYSLARTSVEVVQATASFAKMGYNLSQAKELAKTAMIMQNVGDIEDAKQATDYLISTVKAYNVEAQDSIKIVDSLNNVSNKHSVTVRGLAEGLQRSASIMAQSGNTMEQTVALLTSANASIQHPEKVANGFKTIALRLRGVDEEGGQVFPKLEALMNKVGVKIRNTNGEFLSTYEVLKQLSTAWGSLDSMTKSLITQQAAGVYQANVFEAVLNNFGEAEKTLSDGINSTNSALNENERYMQSVEARYKQFQVRLEQLYETFFSSDLLKGFLTIGEGIVSLLTKVTNGFGGITVATSALAGGFLLLSKNFRVFTTELTSGWATSLMSAITSLTARFGIMTTNINTARVAMKGLQLASGLVASLGIGLLLQGIFKLIDGIGEAKRKQEEYFSGLSQSIQTLSTDVAKMNQLANELKVTKDNERSLQIQKELAQVLPDTVSGYTAEGEAISNNLPLIREMIKLKEQELEQKRQDLENKFQVDGEDKFNQIQKQKTELEQLNKEKQKILQEYQDVKSKPALTTEANKDDHLIALKNDLEKVTVKSNELRIELIKNQQEFNSMTAAVLSSNEAFSQLGTGTLNKLVTNLQSLSGIDLSNVFDGLRNSDFASTLKRYNDEMNQMVKDGRSKNDISAVYTKGFAELSIILKTVAGHSIDAKQALDGLFNVPENGLTPAINDSTSALNEFRNALTPLEEEIAVYNQLLEDSKEKKKLNGQEISNLISKYPELINAISTEGGVIKLNEKALINLRNARYGDVNATVSSVNQKLSVLEAQLRQELNINDKTIQSLSLVAQARANAYSIEAKAFKTKTSQTGYLDKFDSKIVQDKMENSEIGQKITQYENLIKEADNIKKLAGLVKAGNYGVSGGGKSGGSKGSKSSSPKTSKSSTQVQIEAFTSALAKAKTEYSEMTTLLSRKTKLGIVSGFEAFQEKLHNSENYVQKLFDIPSELEQKLKDYKAKLGQYKSSSKEYRLIQAQIVKINKEKATTLKLQETEIQKLKALQLLQSSIQYKTSKWSLDLKVAVGLLKGFSIGDEGLNLFKTKIDGLFEQVDNLNNQIQANQEQITTNINANKKILDARSKTKKNSTNYKELTAQSNALVKANKDLISSNNKLTTEKNKQTAEIIKQNTEYEKQLKIHDELVTKTETWKDRIKDTIDKIKEMGSSFKDTLKDVGLKISLNSKFNTDLFGTTEDLFGNIKDTLLDRALGYEKFKDSLSKLNSDVANELKNLLSADGTTTDKEELKKILDAKDKDITEALKSSGLTENDLLTNSNNLKVIIDIINKQKEETKIVEDRIKGYEQELDAFDKKVDEQEKLNQLKEKELKISEIQAEIDKVKADKRFEIINEQGQKVLTYDTSKVTDLEKQKTDAEKDKTDYLNQLDIEAQKKALQDKIDANRKYLDEVLPKLQSDELAAIVNQNQRIIDNETITQAQLTNIVKQGIVDRANLLNNQYSTVKFTNTANLPQAYTPMSNVNNSQTTNLYFGEVKIEGKFAEQMYDLLQSIGLTTDSMA